MQSPDSYIGRTIRQRSWPGSWISISFAMFLTSVHSLLYPIIANLLVQTELATNAEPNPPGARCDVFNPHAAVPDPQHDTPTNRLPDVHEVSDRDVVHPQPVVSEIQGDLTGTRTCAPDNHNGTPKSQGRKEDRDRPVSTTICPPVVEWPLITCHRLGLRKVSDIGTKEPIDKQPK